MRKYAQGVKTEKEPAKVNPGSPPLQPWIVELLRGKGVVLITSNGQTFVDLEWFRRQTHSKRDHISSIIAQNNSRRRAIQ